MPEPELPMPTEQLGQRLSIPLGGSAAGPALHVTGLSLVRNADGLGLRLDVTAGVEHWLVTIPLDPIDLDPEVSADALVVTLRANLEEWWHTKDHDSRVAGWGVRRAAR